MRATLFPGFTPEVPPLESEMAGCVIGRPCARCSIGRWRSYPARGFGCFLCQKRCAGGLRPFILSRRGGAKSCRRVDPHRLRVLPTRRRDPIRREMGGDALGGAGSGDGDGRANWPQMGLELAEWKRAWEGPGAGRDGPRHEPPVDLRSPGSGVDLQRAPGPGSVRLRMGPGGGPPWPLLRRGLVGGSNRSWGGRWAVRTGPPGGGAGGCSGSGTGSGPKMSLSRDSAPHR